MIEQEKNMTDSQYDMIMMTLWLTCAQAASGPLAKTLFMIMAGAFFGCLIADFLVNRKNRRH